LVSATDVGSRRPARRLHLLVIDDDPLVLRTMAELLSGDGHQVTAVNGGQLGIDTFKSALAAGEIFDVVITDLNMLHVDGDRVTMAIKAARAVTPVILLTGWTLDADARVDRPLGADRVLGKPPRLSVLRHALAELSDRPEPAAGADSPKDATLPRSSGPSANHSGGATGQGVLSGQLESLRGEFYERLKRDRAELAQIRDDLTRAPTEASHDARLMRSAHRLRGISSSFGYAQLGARAAALEAAAREAAASEFGRDLQRIDRLVGELLRELDAAIGDG
jgi:CheY-like chemotaxis protein/HPt (histidine-containing phosphotransfer) domain-containing protein